MKANCLFTAPNYNIKGAKNEIDAHLLSIKGCYHGIKMSFGGKIRNNALIFMIIRSFCVYL